MTDRKPAGMSFESWVDKQIRESEQHGDISKLPGFGKPLESIEAPYDESWWIKRKMQREGVSVLPPALALRKEAEDVRAAVFEARTEGQVRRMLAEVNEKIGAAVRMPPPGPVLNIRPFDIDAVVEEWRATRPS
ncbi:DnaJ family domain-containing protein [Streptomyces sp. NPDC056061]|uniref:DnaJ family domain-containing protein n=1 Tax=Streptomyces sp. NPDC056061 TaxID=3345700 RepID=UPI0035DF8502